MNFILTLMTKTFFTAFTIVIFSFALIAQETVTDYDGNVYQTVTIGSQVWMKENLKTTHYRNGDAIPNVTDTTSWNHLTMGAYCNYDTNASYVPVYGRLYNWYAITDGRNICPLGWHIPSDTEWTTLITYLGGESIAGGKMKEAGTAHWASPNTGATNSSGFTALPAGIRVIDYYTYSFMALWMASCFWSLELKITHIDYLYTWIQWDSVSKGNGYSVRCLKDASAGVNDPTNGKQIPSRMELNQNFPNPFNPSTVISYQLPVSSKVKLSIYNVLGQKIKTLVNTFQNAGEHSLVWDATGNDNNPVSSGVYFYCLQTDKMSFQKKMVLVR
jgi:uncharacterized protein (TIGR02145 family)